MTTFSLQQGFCPLSTSLGIHSQCSSPQTNAAHITTCQHSSSMHRLRWLPDRLAFCGAYLRELQSPRFPAQGRGQVRSHAVVRSEQAVEELPANLQKIVKSFQMVPDPMMRYRQLLYYATKLKPLAPEHHTQENKVVGCVSQVWVLPTLKEDGTVSFQADSDSQLTKGLAALLVEGLTGATPSEILKITPDFMELLGLRQKLTPSRSNGFLNMFKLMQKKTLQLYMESQRVAPVVAPAAAGGEAGTSQIAPEDTAETSGKSAGSNGRPRHESSTSGRPIADGMQRKLTEGLQPAVLEIIDESHQHAGHAGVHKGATETHFNVKIVSAAFEGKNTVKRHRMVYELLGEEFKGGLHALSLSTKTPAEAGLLQSQA